MIYIFPVWNLSFDGLSFLEAFVGVINNSYFPISCFWSYVFFFSVLLGYGTLVNRFFSFSYFRLEVPFISFRVITFCFPIVCLYFFRLVLMLFS